MPEHGIGHDGNWKDPIKFWWIDPNKKAALNKAKKDPSITLEISPEIIDYWNKIIEAE